jgi:hypothetical protein
VVIVIVVMVVVMGVNLGVGLLLKLVLDAHKPILCLDASMLLYLAGPLDEFEPVATVPVAVLDEPFQVKAAVGVDDEPSPFGYIGAVNFHLGLSTDGG